MKWFLKVLRQYADFEGRASREEYWMFVLFNFIFSFVFSLIGVALVAATEKTGAAILPYLYVFVVLIPGLAVTIRRLHDTGRSAWFLLVSLIPIIGSIWLFITTILDGTPGENRYGRNPKDTGVNCNFDRTKSAAVALIISSVVWLLLRLHSNLSFISHHTIGSSDIMPILENLPMLIKEISFLQLLRLLLQLLVPIGLMIAGFLLLKGRKFTNIMGSIFILTSAIWIFDSVFYMYDILSFLASIKDDDLYAGFYNAEYLYMIFEGLILLVPIGLILVGISMFNLLKEYKKIAAYLLIVGLCIWIVAIIVNLFLFEINAKDIVSNILFRSFIMMPVSLFALAQALLIKNADTVAEENGDAVQSYNHEM